MYCNSENWSRQKESLLDSDMNDSDSDESPDPEIWSHGRQLLLERCKSRALKCLNDREYSRAFAHFFIALTIQPSVKGEVLNAFLFTLEKVTDDLEKENQVNEVLMFYEQALEVLPHDSHVLHGLATTLFRFGYVECALSYFLKSYQANPFFTPSLYCMENLKNALVERWHFGMLNDWQRNMAYMGAIKRAVEKGYNEVLDIGSGTGIFSMMALDVGAEKVYACEASEIMFAVLQNVIKTNDKSVKVFQKFSTDLTIPSDLPEKVSLIVTEIFDAGLFGEQSLETLNHAWDNLLQDNTDSSTPSSDADSPSDLPAAHADSNNLNEQNSFAQSSCETGHAQVIPHSATVFAVPVECERFRKHLRLDNDILQALDIKHVVLPQVLDEEPYSTEKINNIPGGCKMLSEPSAILDANFNSPQEIKSLLQGKAFNTTFSCSESGCLDAFVVWFKLHLDPEASISTAPMDASASCCWEQAIFFVMPQYLNGSSSLCNAGDTIQTEFLCRGHLSLKNVKISGAHEINSSQSLTMDPSLIFLLNSYVAGNIINLNIKDIYDADNTTILDISMFPILGLKSLKETASTVTVLKSQYQTDIEQLCDIYQVSREKLIFKSYEDFYKTNLQSDILIIDPVELCGLLKKNLLEDVTMLRMKCLKESGLVVPGEIEIWATIIESEVLKEQSKVISDERTAGYKISQIMNAYQCRVHQDIQYSTLPHRKLSKTVKLRDLNLNSRSESDTKILFNDMHRATEVEVIDSGCITAILYWFTLKYNSNFVVDTSNPDGLWKQAACVLGEDVQVTKGENLTLHWSLKNGCFQVGVYNQESSILK